jgi:hypothetical protein
MHCFKLSTVKIFLQTKKDIESSTEYVEFQNV